MLGRVHHMQIEEPVEEAHFQCCRRIIGKQAHRAGMVELQILDDDARLGDIPVPIYQQRKLGDGPARQPAFRMLRRFWPHAPELERRCVLIKRDQHLLRVGRKEVSIEGERHVWLSLKRLRNCHGR